MVKTRVQCDRKAFTDLHEVQAAVDSGVLVPLLSVRRAAIAACNSSSHTTYIVAEAALTSQQTKTDLRVLHVLCVLHEPTPAGTLYQRVRQYSLCRDDPGEKWRPYSISTLVLR